MSDGQSYFEDVHGMTHAEWKAKYERSEGYLAHKLLKNKVVKAHWDSLSEDRRLRHIENILHQTPPESRKFDYARWWSEQIVDLVDNGVIGEEGT